jgi:hypothetical protein
MVKVPVDDSTKKLNFFPAKNGISQYYSPCMILLASAKSRLQQALSIAMLLEPMSSQAHNEPDPSNTNAPHTLDCIYFHYNDNEQGGHDLLHLAANELHDYTSLHHTYSHYSSNYQNGTPHC